MCDFKCKKCGSNYHKGCDFGATTLMYFEPIYKDGININPDRNTTTRTVTCLNCEEKERITN